MKHIVLSIVGAALVVAVVIGVLNASIAKAQITPGANPGHLVTVWETIAQAETAQASIAVGQVQATQMLVVAMHARACLEAHKQRYALNYWAWWSWLSGGDDGDVGETAWKSLNCSAFFKATSDAHRQKALEEAQ